MRAWPTWDGWQVARVPIRLIAQMDAPVEVEGLVREGCPFALTPTPLAALLWNVTHIPTGHALARGLLRADGALRVIETALAAPVDWDQAITWFHEHRTDPDYAAAMAPVREAIVQAFQM